jgi:hypothetical protein
MRSSQHHHLPDWKVLSILGPVTASDPEIYGPEPPTATEAADRLAQARRPLLAEPTDVRVYALATLAGGCLVSLAVVCTALSFDSELWLIAVGALIAATGAVSFWEFRAGRVVTHRAKRLRSVGMGLTGGLGVLAASSGLPLPVIFAIGALPCAAVAGLMLVSGRR